MKIQGNLTVTGDGEKVTVQDTDGNPTVPNVDVIKFPSGSVTDNGDGTVTVTSGGVSDHGDLTGLSDNDHPQYARNLANSNYFKGPITAEAFYIHHTNSEFSDSGLIVGASSVAGGWKVVNGITYPHRVQIRGGPNDFSIGADSFGSGILIGTPGIRTYKARGTEAAPTVSLDEDLLAAFATHGYDGTDYGQSGRFRVVAKGTHSNNNTPASIMLDTASTGESTYTTRLTVDEEGIDVNSHRIINVGAPTSGTDAARFQDVGPGFYGVWFRESDGNPPTFKSGTLIFDSNSFYLHSNSVGKPVVSFRGATSGGTALTVKDIDGNPTITNVSTIQFTNGSVTDQGGGVAEVTLASGGGISTLTEGAKSFSSQTALGFNANHFYLSPGGAAGNKILNLRYSKDIIPIFQELVTVSNFAIDPFAPYPYVIETVDIDCKSGSCVTAFYILPANDRNKNGTSVGGLDPIAVSTTAQRLEATGNNTVNRGDCLMLSIPSNTTAKHLRISVTAKKPA